MTALESPYVLSPEQIAGFRRDGHVCLRGLCSPDEVAAFRPAIADAAMRYNHQARPLSERDDYGRSFLQIINLWAKDDAVRPFSLARRFGRLAAGLMGVDGVRLYHDQALFKEPGGGPTFWHQDQTYMPFDTPHLIGLWIALSPVPAEVGSMRFVSGSHKLGWLGPLPWSAEADGKVARVIAEHGLSVADYGAMRPGDATAHSAWTLHAAGGNPTAEMRQIMNLFYVDAAAIICEPDTPERANGLRYNLPGQRPGDPVDGPMNPLVYGPATAAV